MKRLFVAVAATLVFAAPAAAQQQQLRLDLSTVGKGARAAWKANTGLPDPTSNSRADHALVLEKRVATTEVAAAVATVEGIAGTRVTALARLQWNRLNGTHCTGGAPRWNLSITGASGAEYTVFLGCEAAAQTPGDHDAWTMGFWGSDEIRAQVSAQAGADALAGTLTGLAIVFDEGPDSVVLDNLVVTTATADGRWYGPSS
jgi:hypothetical protein